MKYINSFRNKDGSWTSTEWTADEMFGASLIEFLIKFTLLCLLSLVASICLIFVRIYDYEENEKAPNIWGIIISTYFIVDYHYKLILNFAFTFFSTLDIPFWARLNSAILITHILMLIFGDTVYYNMKDDETDKKWTLCFIVVVSIAISYYISYIFI